jgi:hypothetical protein
MDFAAGSVKEGVDFAAGTIREGADFVAGYVRRWGWIWSRPRNGTPGPVDRPGPAQQTFLSGRAGQVFCRAGPARRIYSFFITFYQILCLSLIIEIYKTVL